MSFSLKFTAHKKNVLVPSQKLEDERAGAERYHKDMNDIYILKIDVYTYLKGK